jgi:heme O synthase-like polyprenyltransferase
MAAAFGRPEIYVEFIFTLADISAVQIGAITLAFLVLNALLWYSRPNGSVWLICSVVLGVIWGAIFLRLITNEPGRKAE